MSNNNDNKFVEKNNDNKKKIFDILYLGFVCAFSLSISFLSSLIIETKNNKNFEDTNNYITVDEMINLINNSTNLNEEEKEYLINENFFEDIVEYINYGINSQIIAYKLVDMDIVDFTEEEKEWKTDSNGFYDEGNLLHVKNYNGLTKDNHDTVSHEFIHMFDNIYYNYPYVHEASDSLFNYEYYTKESKSYSEQQIRLKVLMEIIGPEIIWKYYFGVNSDEILENSIKNYLNEEESKELLELFKTKKSKNDNIDIEEVHKRVDELLGIMYYNKHNDYIYNDEIITAIYNNLVISRNYFNITNQIIPSSYFNIINGKKKDKDIKLIKNIFSIKRDNSKLFNKFYLESFKCDRIYDSVDIEEAIELGYISFNDTYVKVDYILKEDFTYEMFNEYNIVRPIYKSDYNCDYVDGIVSIEISKDNWIDFTVKDAVKLGYIKEYYEISKKVYNNSLENRKVLEEQGYVKVETTYGVLRKDLVMGIRNDKVFLNKEKDIPNINYKFGSNESNNNLNDNKQLIKKRNLN